jgi:hypothetical protein
VDDPAAVPGRAPVDVPGVVPVDALVAGRHLCAGTVRALLHVQGG